MNSSAYKVVLCQILTLLCDRMLTLALSWHIASQSGVDSLATFLTISLLPQIFMIFLVPPIIRKFGAINIIVYSEAFRGLLYGLALLAIFYDMALLNNTMLIVLAVFTNIAASIFGPAAMTLPYILVREDKLQKFMSIMNISGSLAGLVGAPIGIFAYNLIGIRGLFVLSMSVYFVSALIQRTIQLKTNPFGHGGQSSGKGVSSPIEYWKKYRLPSALILLYTLVAVIMAPLAFFVPGFVISIFNSGSYSLAWLEGAIAIGTIAGGLFLLVGLLESVPIWKTITLAQFVFSLCYIAFALNSSASGAAIILFVLGFFSAIESVFILKVMQLTVRLVDVPFTLAIVSFTGTLAAPSGIALASYATNLIGIQTSAAIFGSLSFLVAFGFSHVLYQGRAELEVKSPALNKD